MDNEKYELLKDDTVNIVNTSFTLYRIRALRDFCDVKAGDLGGYIQSEKNLSHEGNCWVYDKAKVWDHAHVRQNALVYGHAKIMGYASVWDNAHVGGYAYIKDHAYINGSAVIKGSALISDYAKVMESAYIYGDNTRIIGNAVIEGSAAISNAIITDQVHILGSAKIVPTHNIYISGRTTLLGNAMITSKEDYSVIEGFGAIGRVTTFFRCTDNKIRVSCGCFTGTLEEFRKQVKATRTGKIADEYLMIADLMEKHFEKEE